MNFTQLRVFDSVFRNKSFTKAAEELNVSQPALSNHIKSLEDYLEFQLFERTTRQVIPTESSHLLYNYVSVILRDFNNLHKEVKNIKVVGSGKIVIGIIESSKMWFLEVVKDFIVKYPDTQFEIHEMGADNIEQSVLNNEIHFGITTYFSDSSNIETVNIYEEELLLITSKEHPFNELDEVEFINLENQNLVYVKSGYQIKNTIDLAYKRAGFTPNKKYTVERLETACILVERNLAVAIVPESYLLYSHTKNIHLIKLKKPTPIREVYLTYNKQRHLTTSVNHLLFLIKSFFNTQNC